ncbi:MAG: bifunctional UDP-N-acetylglucosamine diphosphorylase/glucosamine-1-phosphate N-acetyltransferase GlmU [Nitrospirota bacterium]|jgi:bifunctional UDP-N-acetylglucosamine pyrophosphorylase/glucosamine-1-phosphate N-acetyltransferase
MAAKRSGLACVILAAGLGTRMKSETPKVLHGIYGKPLLQLVLDSLGGLRPRVTVVVVAGGKLSRVRDAVRAPESAEFVLQRKQSGTAHALKTAARKLPKGFEGTVLVVNGDTPLLLTETLRKFLALHRKDRNDVSFISFMADDPGSYGRVLRGPGGKPARIVEKLDATAEQLEIEEVNSGVYAFESPALRLLGSIGLNERKGEYYLTDVVEIASQENLRLGAYCLGSESEFLGVNTREELALAHEVVRERTVEKWISRGVSFMDMFSVHIEPDVTIGADTVIYPNVYLQGATRVGRRCTVYPNVRIVDSTVKDGAVIKDTSLVEESVVGPGAAVGPFAHLRPGSRIGRSSKIGNFVEVKASSIGEGTKAMHLSYIGDAEVGAGVNIGAGTITCNYDGARKHKTKIGKGVFVGSDTQLVAPVKVGRGAYIGAGTTVTKDVPPGHLATSRAPQKNINRRLRKKK